MTDTVLIDHVINGEDAAILQFNGKGIAAIPGRIVIANDDFPVHQPGLPAILAQAAPDAEWGLAIAIGAQQVTIAQLHDTARLPPDSRFLWRRPAHAAILGMDGNDLANPAHRHEFAIGGVKAGIGPDHGQHFPIAQVQQGRFIVVHPLQFGMNTIVIRGDAHRSTPVPPLVKGTDHPGNVGTLRRPGIDRRQPGAIRHFNDRIARTGWSDLRHRIKADFLPALTIVLGLHDQIAHHLRHQTVLDPVRKDLFRRLRHFGGGTNIQHNETIQNGTIGQHRHGRIIDTILGVIHGAHAVRVPAFSLILGKDDPDRTVRVMMGCHTIFGRIGAHPASPAKSHRQAAIGHVRHMRERTIGILFAIDQRMLHSHIPVSATSTGPANKASPAAFFMFPAAGHHRPAPFSSAPPIPARRAT